METIIDLTFGRIKIKQHLDSILVSFYDYDTQEWTDEEEMEENDWHKIKKTIDFMFGMSN